MKSPRGSSPSHCSGDFPDHHIVMDEEIEDPQLRKLNEENEKSPYQWHVNSLQGTSDYLGISPTWSFQMVLLYKGAPIVAVAIFPELKKEENPHGLLLNMRHDRPVLNVDGELLTSTSVWSFVKPFLTAQVQSAFELGASGRPQDSAVQIKMIPSPREFHLMVSQAQASIFGCYRFFTSSHCSLTDLSKR